MNLPEIIFIIPYRDRAHEKQLFSVYMKYILEDLQATSYEIYYSHQCDDRPFNRGAIKNIGFLAMKNKYPDHYKNITFVFNDIDTLPYFKNTFNYKTKIGYIKHFFGFTYALGGIVSITGADFEKCNGFPNYWGWGLEDNELNNRAIKNNIIIDRSEFFEFNDFKNILHIKNTPNRTISNESSKQHGKKLSLGLNGIINLKYTIDNELINITEFTTEINHLIGKYYTQNISKNNRIKYDIDGKNYHNTNKIFQLNRLF